MLTIMLVCGHTHCDCVAACDQRVKHTRCASTTVEHACKHRAARVACGSNVNMHVPCPARRTLEIIDCAARDVCGAAQSPVNMRLCPSATVDSGDDILHTCAVSVWVLRMSDGHFGAPSAELLASPANRSNLISKLSARLSFPRRVEAVQCGRRD